MLLLLFVCTVVKAQKSAEIGVIISPANINILSAQEDFKSIFTVNYGVQGSLNFEKFSFNLGLIHLTQGGVPDFGFSIPITPEKSVNYHRAKGISLPIIVDFNMYNQDETRIFLSAGIQPTYLCCRYTITNSQGIINRIDYPTTGADKYYLGLNVGIGFHQQVNENWNAVFKPNFIYQLNKNNFGYNSFNDPNFKFRSFALDLGLMYRLK